MANISREKAADILRRSISQLAENSQITRLTPGSKARTLLSILSSEIERLGETLTAGIIMSLLGGAQGDYLDFLGDLVGQPRQQASAASVLAAEQLIQITPPAGLLFGDLNSGTQIIIPAGTPILSADGLIRYATSTQLVLPPAGSAAYTGARAALAGTASNVGPNVLTVLDFTNYASYPSRVLVVTNLSAIESGANTETDDIYRYRIQNATLSNESANLTAIRLAALSVPSTTDVTVLNLYRGVGTADVIVDSETGTLALPVLNQVRSAVNKASAVGMSIATRAPTLIGLEVSVTLKLPRGLSSRDKADITRAVRLAVQSLVSQTRLGGILQVNDIAFAVRRADPRIIDVGIPGRPLDEVVIFRPSPIETRSALIVPVGTNIELAADQRLVLEGAVDQAINVRIPQ